jgi:hypothetical protein
MNSDSLGNIGSGSIFAVIGLILFVAAFTLVLVRVIRMDRKEIDTASRLPLDAHTAAVNGDIADE